MKGNEVEANDVSTWFDIARNGSGNAIIIGDEMMGTKFLCFGIIVIVVDLEKLDILYYP